MPKLIKLIDGHADYANDAYVFAPDDVELPGAGAVIISLARFKAEGDTLLDEGRTLGVVLEAGEAVEDLAYDLPRLSLVAFNVPKYRDGRHYTGGRLLRERYGFGGEVRAVGDVLREQAHFFYRCGFDAFEPADGSTPDQWLAATRRYSHVYQRAADGRAPAYEEPGRA